MGSRVRRAEEHGACESKTSCTSDRPRGVGRNPPEPRTAPEREPSAGMRSPFQHDALTARLARRPAEPPRNGERHPSRMASPQIPPGRHLLAAPGSPDGRGRPEPRPGRAGHRRSAAAPKCSCAGTCRPGSSRRPPCGRGRGRRRALPPTQKLRAELEQLRERGLTFTSAWPVAMGIALGDETSQSAVWWRQAWREQPSLWAVSYSRAPWPAAKRSGLTMFDEGRSGPARATGRAPLAA